MLSRRKKLQHMLERMDERMERIEQSLKAHSAPQAAPDGEKSDAWMMEGIGNILGYQAGGKKAEKE